jgi:hypothetical protein
MGLGLRIERHLGIGLVAAALVGACANGTAEVDPTGDGTVVLDGGTKKDAAPATGRDAGQWTGPDAGNNTDPDTGAVEQDSATPNDPDTGVGTPDTGVGTPDTGVGTPDAGPTTCSPITPSYTPTWHADKGLKGDCSTSQINSFWTACMATTSTQTTCDNYANGLFTGFCFDCIVSNAADAKWGPAVSMGQFTELNVGGCYALTGGSTACAQSWQYLSECEHAACDGACGSTEDAYFSCSSATSAAGGACATHATNSTTACATAPAAAKAACALKSTFEASFKSIAGAFCAP